MMKDLLDARAGVTKREACALRLIEPRKRTPLPQPLQLILVAVITGIVTVLERHLEVAAVEFAVAVP
jgi:hypothetical protein